LRACARSTAFLPGALKLADKDGGATLLRCEGGVIEPAAGGAPALILLRLLPKDETVERFRALSQKKVQLRKERVDLAAVVRDAIETASPIIQRHGHNLTVTLEGAPLHLEADPARLAQVLANLLDNAAKYSEAGGHIKPAR
jgi:hypothetical protein